MAITEEPYDYEKGAKRRDSPILSASFQFQAIGYALCPSVLLTQLPSPVDIGDFEMVKPLNTAWEFNGRNAEQQRTLQEMITGNSQFFPDIR